MSDKNGRAQTWLGLVREYFPAATDTEADALLWNATPFPFGSEDSVRARLAEAAERSGQDVEAAIDDAYEQLDKAMEEANR